MKGETKLSTWKLSRRYCVTSLPVLLSPTIRRMNADVRSESVKKAMMFQKVRALQVEILRSEYIYK